MQSLRRYPAAVHVENPLRWKPPQDSGFPAGVPEGVRNEIDVFDGAFA